MAMHKATGTEVVPGKRAQDVFPSDYLRSENYELVGHRLQNASRYARRGKLNRVLTPIATRGAMGEAEQSAFEDLPARCDVAVITPKIERLRAFYCVEYLYWYIVPTLGLNVADLLGPWDVTKDFKRSRVGLTELVGKLQKVADEVVIRSTELSFASPRTSSVSTGSYLSANLLQRKSSVLAALGAATLLRVKLRGPIDGIHVIGATAATCIITTPTFRW
jgi:hypothetical protein